MLYIFSYIFLCILKNTNNIFLGRKIQIMLPTLLNRLKFGHQVFYFFYFFIFLVESGPPS